MSDADWKWYAGSDEENYSIGPCDTREEALAQASDEVCGEYKDDDDGTWKLGIHLVEARKDPLRLADWIDVKNMLERADEAVWDSDRGSECDDPPYFDVSAQQEADLTECIKRVCDAWQAAHNVFPQTWCFSASRNHEFVVVPLPQETLTT